MDLPSGLAVFVCLCCSLLPVTVVADYCSVNVYSEIGDEIGQGGQWGQLTPLATITVGGSVEISFPRGLLGETWYFAFQSNSSFLKEGLYQGGVDIHTETRSCVNADGSFEVVENEGEELFQASFTQYCDGSKAALTGMVKCGWRSFFDMPGPTTSPTPVVVNPGTEFGSLRQSLRSLVLAPGEVKVEGRSLRLTMPMVLFDSADRSVASKARSSYLVELRRLGSGRRQRASRRISRGETILFRRLKDGAYSLRYRIQFKLRRRRQAKSGWSETAEVRFERQSAPK